MDTVKDIYIQKCRNFSSIDEESFQKIIDLRDKSKGDKIYDDQKIDKESHHLLIYLKEILVIIDDL